MHRLKCVTNMGLAYLSVHPCWPEYDEQMQEINGFGANSNSYLNPSL